MSLLSQRQLSGGEISPSVAARTDTAMYQTGLAKLRNAVVQKFGTVTSRAGSKFVAQLGASMSSVGQLIPFTHKDGEAYVVWAENLKFRFIADGEFVLQTAITVTGVSTASPAVFTSVAHGYSNNDWVRVYPQEAAVTPIASWANIAGRYFVVKNVTANTFTLEDVNGTAVNGTGLALVSNFNVARVYTVASPYTSAEASELKWAQNGVVLYLTHKSFEVRKLTFASAASWALSTITFAPSLSSPGGVTVTPAAAGTAAYWVVTAVKSGTYEESIASSSVGSSIAKAGLSAAPQTVTWNQVSGAVEYNIYRRDGGNQVFGYIGTSSDSGGATSTFVDDGYTPDFSDNPPIQRTPCSVAGTDTPSCVGVVQQRVLYANGNDNSEIIHASQIGNGANLNYSQPIVDSDGFSFSLASRVIQPVKHIAELGGKAVVFSETGEWVFSGNESGTITPTNINAKLHSSNGANNLAPITITGSAIYVQARSEIVRDLAFDFQIDGYKGDDLGRYADHLTKGYTIISWAYQQTPNSVIWMVRSDGLLLSMTYLKEENIFAWARHDMRGSTFQRVCVIPEGNEDVVYAVVSRGTKTNLVRMYHRRFDETHHLISYWDTNSNDDCFFIDEAKIYDGRALAATGITVTLTSGGGWDYTDTITVTASASIGDAGFWGDEVHVLSSDGELIRITVDTRSSATVCLGRPSRTVPVADRSTAKAIWGNARVSMYGLQHLEGLTVSAFGDNLVAASANNAAYTAITVTSGVATFDKAYVYLAVGIPVTADLKTLSINTWGDQPVVSTYKNINRVILQVQDTRGVFAGHEEPVDDSKTGLYELQIRENEGYNSAVDLHTGYAEIDITGDWNQDGQVFVRQVDPLPFTVLSITPSGMVSKGRG